MASSEKSRGRAERAGDELRQAGAEVLRAPALIRFAEYTIRFLLGATLSGAEIFGGYAPFGLAMVGASGGGWGGFSALLGTMFGYLSFQGLAGGLRYGAAGILIFSFSFAFYDTRFYRKTWFVPVVAAVMDAATGIVYLTERGWLVNDLVFFATEVLLAGAGTYFYRLALSPWAEKGEGVALTQKQKLSLLIMGGTVLITLAKIDLYGGISLGRLCAVLTVMALAYRGGADTGAAVGVTAGLAMDLAVGDTPYYSMAYALAGLMAGAFSRQGRFFTALAYVLANGVTALWVWSGWFRISGLYEVFVASVLFLLLPERLFRSLGALIGGEAAGHDTARVAQDYLRQRLEGAASAFRGVQEVLRGAFAPVENPEDAAQIFRTAADKTCRRCALRGSCWQKDYVTTYNALNDALPAMLERGRGETGDFPPHFANKCIKLGAFLAAVNEALTAFLYRREFHNRLRESRASVCGQYGALADILGDAATAFSSELAPDRGREKRLRRHLSSLGVEGEAAVYYDARGRLRAEVEGGALKALQGKEESDRLRKVLGVPVWASAPIRAGRGERVVLAQAEPLAALAGAAARQKDGQTVSGDVGAWFKREDGVLFALLCDGMGAGLEASRESALAVRLLEQFLKAGVATAVALKTIASALALRGEEAGGFTTVDLLEVDLFTGEAAVYKYGAAPTYVRKKDKVSRLTCGTLPAGAASGPAGEPDVSRFRLERGDWVVLISDGVVPPEEDGWLRDALAGETGSPRTLARTLLEESVAHSTPPGDDKTILTVHIAQREDLAQAV